MQVVELRIMRRTRLTITLKDSVIESVDSLIDGDKLRNRSHAIEFILSQYLKPSVGKAIILAGGVGAKLRPYTYEMPKSLLPIKGKPLLEYMIENLKKAEIYDVMICVGHLGEKIKEYFGDGKRFGVNIKYSEEKTPLGTGGAIKKVKSFIGDDPFLVIHGDVLVDLNLKDLLNFHKEQETIGTATLTTIHNPANMGRLRLHGLKIVNFSNRPKNNEDENHLVNTGVYVFDKKIFEYFPKNETSFMLEDILPKLISDRKIAGFFFDGKWFDVGTMESYEEAIKKS